MHDQAKTVRDEFTRQADSLAASVVFNDETILARIREAAALAREARVLDVASAEDPYAAAVHNALEILRDPSHVRMLSTTELRAAFEEAGLEVASTAGWINHREFDEWLKIVNAPERVEMLRPIMTALAKAGVDAGIKLRLAGGQILFEHTPQLTVARKRQGPQ